MKSISHYIPLPKLSQSKLHWRPNGITYPQNEIYFDIYEVVFTTLTLNGPSISSMELCTEIWCNSKLSGMPVVSVSFNNPNTIVNSRLHQCVKLKKFETEKILNFVPPDGNFNLLKFVTTPVNVPKLPFQVVANLTRYENSVGKLIVKAKSTIANKKFEFFRVRLCLPDQITIGRIETKTGKYARKEKIDVIFAAKTYTAKLSGMGKYSSLNIYDIVGDLEKLVSIEVAFSLKHFSLSNLKISSVQVTGENYKVTKGVKSSVKSGHIEVRISHNSNNNKII
ncbi:Clathrin adaptor, mu subunit domain-containing protein [Rozella allomycis CSF55]|uniref:Clathrin adaptor, mu subunit domain-containing protein n=2 Tax=Rozella allomycis (strain CSF55) TaxID=988480 RepID=A0A075B1K2_ROZAC|nr:Clathrin adaptor, mu subunit domain-containing protein [Rozella allomycis CSF55]|eukprot:EPZ34663.1 Clathrin adaptor, mu subunit domain-containing protein [Rozella allomycis CSF55]